MLLDPGVYAHTNTNHSHRRVIHGKGWRHLPGPRRQQPDAGTLKVLPAASLTPSTLQGMYIFCQMLYKPWYNPASGGTSWVNLSVTNWDKCDLIKWLKNATSKNAQTIFKRLKQHHSDECHWAFQRLQKGNRLCGQPQQWWQFFKEHGKRQCDT